jgi:hypothetical protein
MLRNTYQLPRNSPVAERCALAHELTNDLAIIIGDCDLLEDVFPAGSAALERLRKIKAVARRMAEQVATRSCPSGETIGPVGW